MSSPRILIPTLLWRRHVLFEIWAEHHKRFNADVLVCGSEQDISAEIAARHGFYYVEAPNQPLGLKAQIRLEATRQLEWDYLLFLGSDDFITSSTLAYYRKQMQAGYDLIAPMDIFYYAAPQRGGARRLWHSSGYPENSHRFGEPMAVGRALSRAFVERLDFQIWPPVKKNIDGPAWRRIRGSVRKSSTFRLRNLGLMILDVKTRGNLSRFDERRPNISPVPDEYAYMDRAGAPASTISALYQL